MIDKPMKAYSAHDGDEGWAIVFATNGAAARRYAANEMNCDFSEVDYCCRVKGFDKFSPGPVPILEQIAFGWRFECCGCGRWIEDGMEEYAEEDGVVITVDDAVERGSEIFCSAVCMAKEDIDRAERKAAEQKAIADMLAELRWTMPGAVPTRTHAYVHRKDGRYQPEHVLIDFAYPGQKYHASVTRDDLSHTRRKGEFEVRISNGDVDAFNAWHAEFNGGDIRMDDDGAPVARETT